MALCFATALPSERRKKRGNEAAEREIERKRKDIRLASLNN